jgi:hypothetical protein
MIGFDGDAPWPCPRCKTTGLPEKARHSSLTGCQPGCLNGAPFTPQLTLGNPHWLALGRCPRTFSVMMAVSLAVRTQA